MPLYEYECNACHDRFEVIQKVDEDHVNTCKKCGGKVRRLISAPSFRFRGTGWYVTDYGKGKSSDAGKGEEKKETPKKEAASKGTDSAKGDKPAKKK
ncbi:MAG: FmdB family zinc ribbon protein [Acidobacteriota bacterium]